MSFEAYETSIEGSQPVEIYRFVLGADSYEYTSSEDEVTVAALVYTPESIQRGRVTQGAESSSNVLEVTVPASNPFAVRFLSATPGQRTSLVISRVQRSDFPSPEVVTLFTGFVRSVGFLKQGKVARIGIAPTTSATSRPVPRSTCQSLCNRVLYDDFCQVDATSASYRLTEEVTGVSGATIDVTDADTFSDGTFTSGYVQTIGTADFRLILDHTGTTLTLSLPFPSDVTGQQVYVQAGCDHSIATCKTKFDNVINFGGFAFVPLRNPFESGVT